MWSLAGLTGTAAIVAAAGGATWHYTSRLTEPPGDVVAEPPPLGDLVDVVGSTATHVRLRGLGAARTGTWGVEMPGGYLQVGAIVDVDDGVVEREATLLAGTVRPGSPGWLDAYAWPFDGTGLPGTVREVTFTTELGAAPATLVMPEQAGTTWLVTVHGRTGHRSEGFRLASVVVPHGMPTLCISYRNDGEGPRSPDDRSHLGDTEWADVDAAVAFALAHGATHVVLAGFSMGGACVTAALRHGEHADAVLGTILEAPVLDWRPVVRLAAERRGLPRAMLPALLPATMRLATARHGIDWSRTRSEPGTVAREMLLLHGDEDETVPVATSDALAEARPDLVTYVRFPGAGHVRCFNQDRERYQVAVLDWLSSHATDWVDG